MNPSSSHAIQRVGVIGSGTMGAGIAQLATLTGYTVILYDIEQAFLSQARTRIEDSVSKGLEKGKIQPEAASRIHTHLSETTNLNILADVELIIEAAPESLALKKELFSKLDTLAPHQTILASNTSSLSITAMGGATQRPEQVAGLHFFNPVPLMKLVEVIAGARTSTATLEVLTQFAQSLGKTTVQAKDTPGFIVNRVARPFYGEAFRLLGEQAASVETIDGILKSAGQFRMGPFELIDLIGMDVNFAVTQAVYEATFFEPRYKPHLIQQKMVEAGLLGRKTGQGFYHYDPKPTQPAQAAGTRS